MKILVLGGSGFVGSHIVDKLLEAGHEVRVYDSHVVNDSIPRPDAEYYFSDIRNEKELSRAMHGVDVVYHCISSTVPGTSNQNIYSDIDINLAGTIRILDIMRATGVSKIIYYSSGGTIYGNSQSIPIREEHVLNPISSYGIVKLAVEKYMLMYMELYSLEPIILRPSNPYGPRQGHIGVQGLISTLLYKAFNHEDIEIWGDGEVIRDYIYISDIADISVKLLSNYECGIYNIGSGTGNSVNEIIHIIKNIVQHDINIDYKDKRSIDVDRVVLDISKICNKYKWAPRVSIVDGITQYYKWINENIRKQGNR